MEMPEESKEWLEKGIQCASAEAVKYPRDAYLTFLAFFQGWLRGMRGGLSEETIAAFDAVHKAERDD